MHPQIAALMLHHIHQHTSGAAHWLAVAQGTQPGPRFLVLLTFAIVVGTVIGMIHHAVRPGRD